MALPPKLHEDCPIGEMIDPEVVLFASVLKIVIPGHGEHPTHISLVPQLAIVRTDLPAELVKDVLGVLQDKIKRALELVEEVEIIEKGPVSKGTSES